MNRNEQRNRNLVFAAGDEAETGRSGERSGDATSLRRTDQPGSHPGGSSPRRDEERHAGRGDAGRSERPAAAGSQAQDGRPCRVMVVDDSPPYRLALRSALENMDGIQVVGEVASGEQAVATRRELAPDLVFMDINLPGMDGIETTRRLKRDAPELVIIGLSVQSDEHTVAAMLKAGAAVHVSKGSGLPEVRDVLGRFT